jgi:hypothetical protein
MRRRILIAVGVTTVVAAIGVPVLVAVATPSPTSPLGSSVALRG